MPLVEAVFFPRFRLPLEASVVSIDELKCSVGTLAAFLAPGRGIEWQEVDRVEMESSGRINPQKGQWDSEYRSLRYPAGGGFRALRP